MYKSLTMLLFQVFSSRDELVKWAQTKGRENGCVIVTGRSAQTKVDLICDRGGVYKGAPTQRKTGTKKRSCMFALQGKYKFHMGGWILEVKNNEHNHVVDEYLEGHPYAMRLTDQEFNMVNELTQQHVQPKNILAVLKEKNPANVSSLKKITNARTKIKKAGQIGDTPMQVFFSTLKRHNYIFYSRVDEGTNAVDGVLFIHSKSYNLWRAYPHVSMIDSTYKTNQYKMPFVQMVGVTSTLKSFCVCHAFISSERADNYIWILERLKDTLDNECIEPRVIVTDRELALMSACEHVFPHSVRLLCRWHIF